MRNDLLSLILVTLTFSFTLSQAQVGIGTVTPKAFFNVPAGRTVLFGNDTSGSIGLREDIYPKLIWYSSKGAFRVGGISGGQDYYSLWDNANVGIYSFASGLNNLASNTYTTSMGYGNITTGYGAISLGMYNIASSNVAISMGYQTTASGPGALCIGTNSIASGSGSVAIGLNVSTNKMHGAFAFADGGGSGALYSNSASNQMMMRFEGGYKFYTSGPYNQALALGVELAPSGNAWQTISDSTRKENFRPVDGSSFLQKIARMRLGSWNYKGQDAGQYRHYGPMAQDFFAAFGHDQLGTIGEDKSINQADFDGVNLIAIQALIKEVEKLEAENNILRGENTALKQDTASLKSDMEQVKKQLTILLKQ